MNLIEIAFTQHVKSQQTSDFYVITKEQTDTIALHPTSKQTGTCRTTALSPISLLVPVTLPVSAELVRKVSDNVFCIREHLAYLGRVGVTPIAEFPTDNQKLTDEHKFEMLPLNYSTHRPPVFQESPMNFSASSPKEWRQIIKIHVNKYKNYKQNFRFQYAFSSYPLHTTVLGKPRLFYCCMHVFIYKYSLISLLHDMYK